MPPLTTGFWSPEDWARVHKDQAQYEKDIGPAWRKAMADTKELREKIRQAQSEADKAWTRHTNVPKYNPRVPYVKGQEPSAQWEITYAAALRCTSALRHMEEHLLPHHPSLVEFRRIRAMATEKRDIAVYHATQTQPLFKLPS